MTSLSPATAPDFSNPLNPPADQIFCLVCRSTAYNTPSPEPVYKMSSARTGGINQVELSLVCHWTPGSCRMAGKSKIPVRCGLPRKRVICGELFCVGMGAEVGAGAEVTAVEEAQAVTM